MNQDLQVIQDLNNLNSKRLKKTYLGIAQTDGSDSRGGSAEPDTSEITSCNPQHEVLLAKTRI